MNASESKEHAFVHRNGVTYFTKRTERRVLFVLTMVLLVWGVVEYAQELF